MDSSRDGETGSSTNRPLSWVQARIIRYVTANGVNEQSSVTEMARQVGVHRDTLLRNVKKMYGVPPKELLGTTRQYRRYDYDAFDFETLSNTELAEEHGMEVHAVWHLRQRAGADVPRHLRVFRDERTYRALIRMSTFREWLVLNKGRLQFRIQDYDEFTGRTFHHFPHSWKKHRWIEKRKSRQRGVPKTIYGFSRKFYRDAETADLDLEIPDALDIAADAG